MAWHRGCHRTRIREFDPSGNDKATLITKNGAVILLHDRPADAEFGWKGSKNAMKRIARGFFHSRSGLAARSHEAVWGGACNWGRAGTDE